ncbi:MAG: hypothetical protein GYA51_10615 [Candidatus Methanofastidiosa archaeon]|jgi:cytochrome b561|nr:hypothetical protein [Candidatus Methanofastidiosa archaeon]
MLNEISYYPIFGYPLIVYLGAMALILFLVAASISTFLKGNIKNHFKIHRTLAMISIVFALIHGVMALLAYL